MADLSARDSRPLHLEEKKHKKLEQKMDDQPLQQQFQLEKYVGSQVVDVDEIPYLSGKLFWDVILAKTQVSPKYTMQLPIKMVRELPRENVTVHLRYNRQNWEVPYLGKNKTPRLGYEWRNFVNDNNLTVGDACVFELLEWSNNTQIRLKVHILRGEVPFELLEFVDTHGTPGNPIVLD